MTPSEPLRRVHWMHLVRLFSRWRLSSRFAALSLLLLLAVQALGYLTIRSSIEDNARRTLVEELEVGERVWERLLAQRAARLGQGAEVLVADFGFRAAVSTSDSQTITSALDNHGARIGASLAALLDTRFALREISGESDPETLGTLQLLTTALAAQLAPQAGAGADTRRPSAVAVVAGKPYQFVLVPMRAPLVVAWVLMAFELDRGLVVDLQNVTRLHATLVQQPPGQPPQALYSSLSLPQAEWAVLADASAEAGDVQLAGETHVLRSVAVSADHSAMLRLSGSLTGAMAPFQTLQLTLGALTLLGLLLFGLGSVWAARRVTRPLLSLVRASERLGRGDYDTPLAHTGRQDEFGDLAKAFEHMRLNIGEQQREIRQLAYWDKLTGLPNRVQFVGAVQTAIAQGGPLAVLMLDLDRFKHVNEVLGYAVGDRLLQGVADRLRGTARPGDALARLSGDEFALLLPGADARQAEAAAARIQTAFEEPLTLDDQRIDLSAGLGMACWPPHATDAESLLNRAEVAMVYAKEHRTGAQLYEPRLDSRSEQTLSLLSELRQAVENHELRLFLQPKVALAAGPMQGRLCGVEALVRWQHPTRGLVPPIQFIPFAEQTGYVRHLTLWVFEEAARQQAALLALGLQRVSINLSTRDLMDIELPDKLEALLLRHRARADAFCLEITESAIMDDTERAEATLNRLSRRGYKLSIDDFGTGFSSLAYLKRLPVDELKVDRGFVMGMQGVDGAKGDATIVRSTIDLAHNLGLSVVAEGVENASVLQRLVDMGCDEAQGYHLGKPMPLVELQAWAQRWAAQRHAAPAPREVESAH